MHITRTISLPQELDQRVEEARGLIPRSAFAQQALETYLQQQTGTAANSAGYVKTEQMIPEKRTPKSKGNTPGLGSSPRKSSKAYELPKIAPRKK